MLGFETDIIECQRQYVVAMACADLADTASEEL